MRTITTADGVALASGERAFNHYDHKAGRIGTIDARPQPDPRRGQSSATPIAEWSNYWFDFVQDDGTTVSLDGSRICTIDYAQRKGWL